jgi:hypothetical protein
VLPSIVASATERELPRLTSEDTLRVLARIVCPSTLSEEPKNTSSTTDRAVLKYATGGSAVTVM